jgi:DMSO/TMAO reductase YedYZ molybdopterin-dependent catalytic subunit
MTMLFIMPLTSAGFFALGLMEGTRSTVLGYLGVGLAYAATLALGRVVLLSTGDRSRAAQARRRWALSLVGGSVGVFTLSYWLEALFPHRTGLPTIVVVADSRDPPSPHPNAVSSPSPSASPLPAPSATAVKTAVAAGGPPEPAAARVLPRDRDGAVLPSGRKPGELAETITSNDNFYIVTKNAGGDPVLHPSDWRLVVDGEVQRPYEVDYTALRKLPNVEVTRTLECVSNLVDKCELAPFGCDLISTARWRGVRLSDVLGLVGGLKPGATQLATISADEYTTAIPIEVAMSADALLVFEMNGQVLPREHGYPARILIPGRYGMKNAKWVVALRPMSREFVDWYGQRSWSREAVVKTMTRIDAPAREARLQAGPQRIAGIAYAGDRGVQKVEFSSNGGESWLDAELSEPAAGRDVWVRWQARFNIATGENLALVARATDGMGTLQSQPFALAQPDGAAGWHNVNVHGV